MLTKDSKLYKYLTTCGTINTTLKNEVRRDTKIKMYKTAAVPVLLYGTDTGYDNKNWKQKTVCKGEVLGGIKEYTRADRISNKDICDKLSIYISKTKKNHKQKKNSVFSLIETHWIVNISY